MGELILALTDEPVSTCVPAQGARFEGERAAAAKLDERAPQYLELVNDRRLRRPDGRLATDVARTQPDHHGDGVAVMIWTYGAAWVQPGMLLGSL